MADRHPGLIRWHYTVATYLPSIIESGEIRPATAGVPAGERPVVWFSVNQQWDETANKSYVDDTGRVCRGDFRTTVTYGGGVVRIGVLADVAPHDWEAFKKMSGVSAKMAKGLYNAATKAGARPGEWYVSFDPVPREKWHAVEVWKDGRWVHAELTNQPTDGKGE